MQTLFSPEIQKKYDGQFPVPVVEIANDCNIAIYETDDFPLSQSGSIRREGENYVMYVKASDSTARKRFTIAHELGHFLIHKTILEQGKESVTENKQFVPTLHRNEAPVNEEEKEREKVVNEFAAELLMPSEKFKEVWNKSNNIAEIAEFFNVSQSAVTVRSLMLFGAFMP